MKKAVFIYGIFTIGLCYEANAPIERLALILKSIHHRPVLQKELTKLLKYLPYKTFLDQPTLLVTSLKALLKNEQSLLYPFKKPLLASTKLFIDTPGYIKTLHIMLAHNDNESIVKGHSYEFERAGTLHYHGELIKCFNLWLSDGNMSRQIDIQTKIHCIECKNMRWPELRNTKTSNLLQEQFLEQLALIRSLKKNYIYQISSKQPIPSSWKPWFAQHDIEVHEEG